jgi:replicative DNA helicase
MAFLSLLITGGADAWVKATTDGIGADNFGYDDAKDIWNLCAARIAKGYDIGITEIKASIRNNKPTYATVATLGDIMEAKLTDPSWSACVGVLQDRLARRIAMQAGEDASNASGPVAVQILQQAAENASAALSTDSTLKSGKQAAAEFIEALLENTSGTSKLPSGIPAIDERTGGIRRGAVWVFGGLPGRGKSAIMFQIAAHGIWAGHNVLVFSLELMAEEVVSRVLCSHGSASASALQGMQKLTVDEITKIKRHAKELASLNLKICDKGGVTIDEIEAYATRAHEQKPLDYLIVDYIQLCEVAMVKGASREQQVAQVSRRLKAMAKKFRCGVITASQLNDDGKMRESRAIKQDADAVFLITPNNKEKDQYDKEVVRPSLTIDKLRGGNPSPPMIYLGFDGEDQRFK